MPQPENGYDNNNTVLLQAQCTKLQSKIYKVPYMTSKNKYIY